MSMNSAPARSGALVGGILLVVGGILLLVLQQTDVQLQWPAGFVVVGLALIALGVIVGPAGQGFAVVGGILGMLGVVLSVQEATGAYASWAYAWALVAPGGVGVGLFLYGLLTGQPRILRSGIGPMVAGLVIFLVGYLIFEGMLGLTGEPLSGVVAPALLVLLGVILVVAAFLPPTLRGASVPPPVAATPSWQGPSAPGPGMAASAGAAASAAGATAAGSGQRVDMQPVQVDLAGAAAGDIAIAFGAGKLAIAGAAGAGRLVDGVAYGGIRVEDGGPGRVKLSTPGEALWNASWTGAPFDWRLAVSGEVPVRLVADLGASKSELDLSALRVSELRLRTGAAETFVTLPGAAGQTRVDIEGGANTVELRIPDGVAARIHSQMALGSTRVDEARFPRDPLGGWASPDFATAANRVEIESRAGMGTLRVS